MRLPAFLPIVLSVVPVLAAQQPVLVEGKWLEKRLQDPKVAVVHVAGSRAEYDAGHLPGARYLPFSTVAPNADGLNVQLPAIAVIDSMVEAIGVSDGQHVVLYGQPLQVARAFVTMERAGLAGSVSVLNGGLDRWRESGRAVSRDAVTPARGSFTPRQADNVVDAPWITQNASKGGIALLDARVAEFYQGLSAGSTARPGRVPGARSVPFSSLTGELTTMRESGKIRRLFDQAGVAKGDTVVTYCHIGMQASLLYLAARSLGFPTRIYDGSFEDWAKRSELPVEKGPGR
jgi:thiosulfate/3-mercaptopyruvate sulfurtransferase